MRDPSKEGQVAVHSIPLVLTRVAHQADRMGLSFARRDVGDNTRYLPRVAMRTSEGLNPPYML